MSTNEDGETPGTSACGAVLDVDAVRRTASRMEHLGQSGLLRALCAEVEGERAKVERLRAKVAALERLAAGYASTITELRLVVAAEQGKAEGALPGWSTHPEDKYFAKGDWPEGEMPCLGDWYNITDSKPIVYQEGPGEWLWWVPGMPCATQVEGAREAMRAAEEAAGAKPLGGQELADAFKALMQGEEAAKGESQ